jgi:hypothetical protein
MRYGGRERRKKRERRERVRGTAFGREEWASKCRRKRPGERGKES